MGSFHLPLMTFSVSFTASIKDAEHCLTCSSSDTLAIVMQDDILKYSAIL